MVLVIIRFAVIRVSNSCGSVLMELYVESYVKLVLAFEKVWWEFVQMPNDDEKEERSLLNAKKNVIQPSCSF